MLPAMDEDRDAFRSRLTELRAGRGLSQAGLAGLVAELSGETVSGSAVSEWERGVSIPSRAKVLALESILDAPTALTAPLGMAAGVEGAGYGERLGALETRMARIEEGLTEIRKALAARPRSR